MCCSGCLSRWKVRSDFFPFKLISLKKKKENNEQLKNDYRFISEQNVSASH
jgi:hypothetical protein